MKPIALITTVVLLVLTTLVVVWRLQEVVGIILIALVIAMAVERPVAAIVERGRRRWLAVLAVYAGSFIVLSVIAVLVFSALGAEADPLVEDAMTRYVLLQARIEQIANDRSVLLIDRLPTTDQVATLIVKNPETGVADGLLGLAQGLLGMAGQIALATVLAIYWSMDSSRFGRLWLSLLPPPARYQTRGFLTQLGETVGAYVRSELLQTLLAGAALTALYFLLHVPYPFTVALFVSIAWLIPIIGGVLAVLIAAGVGSFAGWQGAVAATAATVLVLAVMEFVAQPRLYGRDKQLWGILMVVLMLILGDLLGIVGLLIAPPTALAVQMLLAAIFDRSSEWTAPEDAIALTELNVHLERLKASTAEDGVPVPRPVADLLTRLESLLDATGDAG